MKNNNLWRRVCNPLGSGELTGVEMRPGDTQILQREAVRCFKTGRLMLVLATVLVASVCLPLPLYAPIIPTTFMAGGNESVGSGGSVIVPITAQDFVNVASAQFSLFWDASVLNYVGTQDYNSQLIANGPYTFNPTVTGSLGFLWDSGGGQTLSGTPTIFAIKFTAIGSVGTYTAVSFTNFPSAMSVTIANTDYTPIGTDGGPITVVPEPINWALGLFACVFIGGATVRWISNRRMALQSA